MSPEQKEQYRKRIVEEIFERKIVQSIAYSEAPKRGINWETKIQEDVSSHIFLKLMQMQVDKLIELYEQPNPFKKGGMLVNYIGMMVKNDGYTKSHNQTHRASVATNILFASTLRENLTIDTCEPSVTDDTKETMFAGLTSADDYEPNKWETMWNKVEQMLPADEVAFITEYLRRKRGTKTSDIKKFQKLRKKIFQMFTESSKLGRPRKG